MMGTPQQHRTDEFSHHHQRVRLKMSPEAIRVDLPDIYISSFIEVHHHGGGRTGYYAVRGPPRINPPLNCYANPMQLLNYELIGYGVTMPIPLTHSLPTPRQQNAQHFLLLRTRNPDIQITGQEILSPDHMDLAPVVLSDQPAPLLDQPAILPDQPSAPFPDQPAASLPGLLRMVMALHLGGKQLLTCCQENASRETKVIQEYFLSCLIQ